MNVCVCVCLECLVVCVSVQAEGQPSVKTHPRQINQGPLKDFSKMCVRVCLCSLFQKLLFKLDHSIRD